MTLLTEPLYLDDPDVHVDWPVTDANANDLDWSPVVKTAGGTVLDAEWLGDVASTRSVRVTFGNLTTPGTYRLVLEIPDDNDQDLGEVTLH